MLITASSFSELSDVQTFLVSGLKLRFPSLLPISFSSSYHHLDHQLSGPVSVLQTLNRVRLSHVLLVIRDKTRSLNVYYPTGRTTVIFKCGASSSDTQHRNMNFARQAVVVP